MGRYAQARRRGKVAPTAQGLAPPPAPLASVDAHLVYCITQGLDDTGGRIRLYQANEPLVEKATVIQDVLWASDLSFQDSDPGFYWLDEVGNGTTYAGQSPLSNMVEVVGE